MSKIFRRVASALCAGVMVMSMSVGALAVDSDPGTKGTTITLNPTSGSTTSTYEAFKLLDLTTSLKATGHDTHADGEHTDECYSYTYSVNSTFKRVLSNALKKFDTSLAAVSGDLDDGTIIKKLRTLDDKSIRNFADAVRTSLVELEESIGFSEPNKFTSTTGTFENVPQGYYLIRESVVGDDPDMRMLVMVDTLGQENIELDTKEDVPTLTKKIIENDIAVDGQDAAIGDIVHYQLKSVIPAKAWTAFWNDMKNANGYQIEFVDNLTQGLTLKEDTIKLTINDTEVTMATWDEDKQCYVSDKQPDGADLVYEPWCKVEAVGAADISTNLTITARPKQYIACDDADDITVVVDYDCEVNQLAAIGEKGNPNTAFLTFSNDPYTTSMDKSQTPDDKVTVFSYKLVVDKVNPTGVALTGADFKLQKKNEAGEYVDYKVLNSATDVSTFTFSGLDAGDYKLVETRVPDGYHEGDPIEFSIVATYDKNSDDPKLLTFDIQDAAGNSMSTGDKPVFTVTKADGTASAQFVNVSGGKLPSTGGMGTYMFYIGGGVILVAGLSVLIVMSRKKKSMN